MQDLQTDEVGTTTAEQSMLSLKAVLKTTAKDAAKLCNFLSSYGEFERSYFIYFHCLQRHLRSSF